MHTTFIRSSEKTPEYPQDLLAIAYLSAGLDINAMRGTFEGAMRSNPENDGCVVQLDGTRGTITFSIPGRAPIVSYGVHSLDRFKALLARATRGPGGETEPLTLDRVESEARAAATTATNFMHYLMHGARGTRTWDVVAAAAAAIFEAKMWIHILAAFTARSWAAVRLPEGYTRGR